MPPKRRTHKALIHDAGSGATASPVASRLWGATVISWQIIVETEPRQALMPMLVRGGREKSQVIKGRRENVDFAGPTRRHVVHRRPALATKPARHPR